MNNYINGLASSGDINRLIQGYENSLRELNKKHSEENVLTVVINLLYIVRLLEYKKYYSEMIVYGRKIEDMLVKEEDKFPDNADFNAILSNVYGSFANAYDLFQLYKKARYGIKSSKYYKKAINKDPYNKYALQWEISHYLNAPKAVGGDYHKAIELSIKYLMVNADDEWVKFLMASAYLKVDSTQTQRITDEVLSRNATNYYFLETNREIKGDTK